MTQEDKEFLLKDLCARLPYGVKVLVDNKHWCDFDGRTPSEITYDNSYRLLFLGTKLGYVKPYLYPLSSMTEEKIEELLDIVIPTNNGSGVIEESNIGKYMDWCYKNHFDYRGLIEKGLALDATGLNIY